jgi:hypothetical protein
VRVEHDKNRVKLTSKITDALCCVSSDEKTLDIQIDNNTINTIIGCVTKFVES